MLGNLKYYKLKHTVPRLNRQILTSRVFLYCRLNIINVNVKKVYTINLRSTEDQKTQEN